MTKDEKYGMLLLQKVARRARGSFLVYATLSMTFASTITVPQQLPDQPRAIWEQLIQDGFAEGELKVPPIASSAYILLVHDAKSFSADVQNQYEISWPLRCERWLNRLSTTLTGQMFWELPIPKRQAICHIALTLSGQQQPAL